jgi:hypothetical protein
MRSRSPLGTTNSFPAVRVFCKQTGEISLVSEHESRHNMRRSFPMENLKCATLHEDCDPGLRLLACFRLPQRPDPGRASGEESHDAGEGSGAKAGPFDPALAAARDAARESARGIRSEICDHGGRLHHQSDARLGAERRGPLLQSCPPSFLRWRDFLPRPARDSWRNLE